jgi:hypothetical protein
MQLGNIRMQFESVFMQLGSVRVQFKGKLALLVKVVAQVGHVRMKLENMRSSTVRLCALVVRERMSAGSRAVELSPKPAGSRSLQLESFS